VKHFYDIHGKSKEKGYSAADSKCRFRSAFLLPKWSKTCVGLLIGGSDLMKGYSVEKIGHFV